ncbi:MAG: hypothetical protein QM640_15595 [Niabella sp.]
MSSFYECNSFGAVKFLIHLLAFYLLLLPATGIAGNYVCDESFEAQSVQCKDQQPDDAHREEEKCNPFCGCACCFHTVSENIQIPGITAQYLCWFDKKYPVRKQYFCSSGFFGNIWQPPKKLNNLNC